ncbi:MAG: YdcH family protein [Bauldia sp.]
MTDEERQIREELERLRQEHRDLDEAIAAMEASGRGDPIRRQRLKKRKLQLKDRIVRLEDRLLPDIIA